MFAARAVGAIGVFVGSTSVAFMLRKNEDIEDFEGFNGAVITFAGSCASVAAAEAGSC